MLQCRIVRPRLGAHDKNELLLKLPETWRAHMVRVYITQAELDPVCFLLLQYREELRALTERTDAQQMRLDELTMVLRTLVVALPEEVSIEENGRVDANS